MPLIRQERARAVTLVELLVAATVAAVFIGSLATAYIQISRAAEEAEARARAYGTARIALDTVLSDLSTAVRLPGISQTFVINNNTLPYGDNIDNDGDGLIDEEVFNGFDDDGDWTLEDDRHAFIGQNCHERFNFVGIPDLGDGSVDEDVRFSRDQLTFRVPANPSDPALGERLLTYKLGSYDGIDHVLLREERSVPPLPTDPVINPVAFDVVSFDVLAWNPNSDAVSPSDAGLYAYWAEEWISFTKVAPDVQVIDARTGEPTLAVPPYQVPPIVLVRVTVSAERFPLAEIEGWPLGGRPLETVSLTSTAFLADQFDIQIIGPNAVPISRYDLYSRPDVDCN